MCFKILNEEENHHGLQYKIEREIKMKTSLTYADISIVPRVMSEIESRSQVDPSVIAFDRKLRLPLIAAPMHMICGSKMITTLSKMGILSFIPRCPDLASIELMHRELLLSGANQHFIGLAIGATDNYMRQLETGIDLGYKLFLVDVANGYSIVVKKAMDKINRRLANLSNETDYHVITGNVASKEGVFFLEKSCSVEGIGVGIGSGAACSTSTRTSVGAGIISSLLETKSIIGNSTIIADGGVKEPGDITKALACGAQLVMAGRIFAGTSETPGQVFTYRGEKLKQYAGEASRVMKGKDKYVEGEDDLVPYKDRVERVITEYENGFRSALSYLNCINTEELMNGWDNNKFEVVRLTHSSRLERMPKII